MKLAIVVCFLLGLSASVVLATVLDVAAQDEAAVGPALTRVRRGGGSHSKPDSNSDSKPDSNSDSKPDCDCEDDDDDECCQNSCDEDYFYELVLRFEDKDAKKELDLGRVVVNEKDCGDANDKSKSDKSKSDRSKSDRSRSDRSKSGRKHHRHHRSSRSRSDSDCSD